MSAVQCDGCNFENENGSKFCKQCGKPLGGESETSKVQPQQQNKVATVVAAMQHEEFVDTEDRFENLQNIKMIYKVLTTIVAIAWLLLSIRVYNLTDSFWTAIIAAMIMSPVVFTVGAQAEKIELSISQERSMRECAFYLKRISKHLGQ